MTAVADLPKRHVRTFDLTIPADREDYQDLLAGESELDDVRVTNECDFPMGGSGAVLRVVDFVTKPAPEFPYSPPIC